MRLIGLAGRARVGKTTLAEMIRDECRKHGYPCEIVPFAAPVKGIAYQMGWDGAKDAKGRRLLQLLGTDAGRRCIHPDIWVRHWQTSVASRELPANAVVIADDVRFANERDTIIDMGGKVYLIERYQRGDWWRGWFRSFGHASERPPACARRVVNNWGIPELRMCAERLVDCL